MKVHTIKEGRLLTTEQTEEELARVGALEKLNAGEAIFLGTWLFGERLRTLRGMQPPEGLDITVGFDGADGSPGSCDAHWFEVRDENDQIIKRAVSIEARGVERKVAGDFGRIG